MALYIVLAVVTVLILLAVILRARLFVSFKDGCLIVTLRILCFKFSIFGQENEKIKKSDFKIKKFRRRRDRVLKKYKINSRSESTIKRLEKSDPKSPQMLIHNVKNIIEEVERLFRDYIRIDRFKVRIAVGGTDAANVALNYGYTVSALQFLVTFLECHTKLSKTKNKTAYVNADFVRQKWDAEIDIVFSVGIIRAIGYVFGRFLKSLTKNKK